MKSNGSMDGIFWISNLLIVMILIQREKREKEEYLSLNMVYVENLRQSEKRFRLPATAWKFITIQCS